MQRHRGPWRLSNAADNSRLSMAAGVYGSKDGPIGEMAKFLLLDRKVAVTSDIESRLPQLIWSQVGNRPRFLSWIGRQPLISRSSHFSVLVYVQRKLKNEEIDGATKQPCGYADRRFVRRTLLKPSSELFCNSQFTNFSKRWRRTCYWTKASVRYRCLARVLAVFHRYRSWKRKSILKVCADNPR